jgi:hypothetical protein
MKQKMVDQGQGSGSWGDLETHLIGLCHQNRLLAAPKIIVPEI